MDKMTLFDHLVDVDGRENNVIRDTLKCTCGNECFNIYYFGKRTSEFLAADILKSNNKIRVVAHYELCDKSYGFDNQTTSRLQFNEHLGLTPNLVIYAFQWYTN